MPKVTAATRKPHEVPIRLTHEQAKFIADYLAREFPWIEGEDDDMPSGADAATQEELERWEQRSLSWPGDGHQFRDGAL